MPKRIRFEDMTHSLCNVQIQREQSYFEEAADSYYRSIRLSEFLEEDKKETPPEIASATNLLKRLRDFRNASLRLPMPSDISLRLGNQQTS